MAGLAGQAWNGSTHLTPITMNFHEFSALDGTVQLKTVGERGVFLMEVHGPTSRSLFYRVRNFFVEVRFLHHREHFAQVISFTINHPNFLKMLCLLPAASLRSIAEKAQVSPLSFMWN